MLRPKQGNVKMFEQLARQQVIALVVFGGDMPEVDVDRGSVVAEWGLLEPDHVPFDFFSPDPIIDFDQERSASPWMAAMGRRNRCS
jgi:hypothetical protein